MRQVQAQAEAKLDEIDTLYGQNDKLRQNLDEIRSKFDLEQYEKDKHLLEGFEAFSQLVIQAFSEVSRAHETYYSCNICHTMAVDILIAEPCGHVFCSKCFHNQANQDKCRACQTPIESNHVCILANEFQEGFKLVNKAVDKASNKLKAIKR